MSALLQSIPLHRVHGTGNAVSLKLNTPNCVPPMVRDIDIPSNGVFICASLDPLLLPVGTKAGPGIPVLLGCDLLVTILVRTS